MSYFSKSIWAERLCNCRSICVLTRQYRATRMRLKCRLAGITWMMGFLFSSGMGFYNTNGKRWIDLSECRNQTYLWKSFNHQVFNNPNLSISRTNKTKRKPKVFNIKRPVSSSIPVIVYTVAKPFTSYFISESSQCFKVFFHSWFSSVQFLRAATFPCFLYETLALSLKTAG